MPSPKELFDQRQRMLSDQQEELFKKVESAQRKLLAELIRKILVDIDTQGAEVKTIADNFDVAKAVDEVFKKFVSSNQYGLIDAVVTDFNSLLTHNEKYYNTFEVKEDNYRTIKKQVRDYMRKRLGLSPNNTPIKGGYIEQLTKDVKLQTEIKETVFRAVVAGKKLSELHESLRQQIVGSPDVDGGLVKYYKGFAYDAYHQFDATTNEMFANKLGLRTFVYAGGLIDDSRDFCVKRNNKAFTIEEAEQFVNDKTLPRTKEEEKSGTITNYIPTIDRGRWNCRHMTRWVSKYQALKLRPDLKGYYELHPESR